MEIVIDPRFNGPPASATAATRAGSSGRCSARLRRSRSAAAAARDAAAWDGERAAGRRPGRGRGARRAELDVELPPPVALPRRRQRRGVSRVPRARLPDLLRLRARAAGGRRAPHLRRAVRPGFVAAPWIPPSPTPGSPGHRSTAPGRSPSGGPRAASRPRLHGGRGAGAAARRRALLVVAQPLGEDGRKLFAAHGALRRGGRTAPRSRAADLDSHRAREHAPGRDARDPDRRPALPPRRHCLPDGRGR